MSLRGRCCLAMPRHGCIYRDSQFLDMKGGEYGLRGEFKYVHHP